MSEVKRRNPRRPFRVTPEGVRRIVLGEVRGQAPHLEQRGEAGTANVRGLPPATTPASPAPAAKPLRPRAGTSAWHVAIVHGERGSLDDHARQAIAAAAILAGPETGVLAIVLGPFEGDAGALGADEAVVIPEAEAAYDPGHETALCSALIRGYRARHVILPDATGGTGDLGRRLVAEHGGTSASHVVEIDAQHVAARTPSGGLLAHAGLPRFVLLAPGAVDAELPFRGQGRAMARGDVPAPVKAVPAIRDLGIETVDASRLALEEADFIVSAGNGVADIGLLVTLAKDLGAAVGASRVVTDEGRLARHHQIGATGKTVAATTYVAIGISGAVQHLQGIKDCRHVIAINRDASAPIVERADLAIIGDAGEVMQALHELIRAARGMEGSQGDA